MSSSSIALWIWYRGDRFDGFQAQLGGRTVQQALLTALSEVGMPQKLAAAGRTDKGAHARMQVIRIPNPGESPERISRLLSRKLPPELGICTARPAPARFHPQWKCISKEYRYRLCLNPVAHRRWAPWSWTPSESAPLQGNRFDAAELNALVARCVGTRDFIAFHESSSPQRLRTILGAEVVEREAGLCEVKLRGDGFGRYQVRYLVGTAVATAAGILSRDEFLEALEGGKRINGLKAPARGLVLWEVFYERAMDPFTDADRQEPPNLPTDPPFAPA